MMELKANPELVEHVSYLIDEARKSTPELSKRGINFDHGDIVELLSDACLHKVLCEIRDELRFMNQEKRLAGLPLSMFNKGMSPQQGE